jgi:hypothetical protein
MNERSRELIRLKGVPGDLHQILTRDYHQVLKSFIEPSAKQLSLSLSLFLIHGLISQSISVEQYVHGKEEYARIVAICCWQLLNVICTQKHQIWSGETVG